MGFIKISSSTIILCVVYKVYSRKYIFNLFRLSEKMRHTPILCDVLSRTYEICMFHIGISFKDATTQVSKFINYMNKVVMTASSLW